MSRKYTKEFKQEAIKLVKEQGYTQLEASRRVGISPNNINRWILEGLPKEESLPQSFRDEQEEIKRLRKENERLRMEKEILKKAAAFFANEKN
jgi:transposase